MGRGKAEGIGGSKARVAVARPLWHTQSQGGSQHGHTHEAGSTLPPCRPQQHQPHLRERWALVCLQRQDREDKAVGEQSKRGGRSQESAAALGSAGHCPFMPGLLALPEQTS